MYQGHISFYVIIVPTVITNEFPLKYTTKENRTDKLFHI